MSEPIRVGSPEWDALTERRAALIRKKNRDGLTAGESEEYERLQAASRAAIEAEFQLWVSVMAVDVCELQLENARLRAELDRIRDLTGQVRHTDPAECVGCGCMSLTAEEAVVYALRELREELAAKDRILLRAADKLAFTASSLRFTVNKVRGGVDAIIGKWPGDETDEEVQQAIKNDTGGEG